MADRTMNDAEAASFLATRPPEPEVAPVVKRGSTVSPDGKPARTPWRQDKAWLSSLAESLAKHTKAAIDATVAPLLKRLAALETAVAHKEVGATSLSHRDANGELIAEYFEHQGRVILRIGEATSSAATGSAQAVKLLEKFDRMSPL